MEIPVPWADKIPTFTQDVPGSSRLVKIFMNRPTLLSNQQLMTMLPGLSPHERNHRILNMFQDRQPL